MLSFSALGDPTRFRIVEMLSLYGELSAGDISNQFEMTPAAISQHLRILKQAQLVQAKPKAQKRIYSLDPQGIDQIASWVASMKQHWENGFDTLETHLAQEPAMSSNPPFILKRTFNAPRERVWRAWTTESELQQWFGPKGCPIFKNTLNLNQGGIYHYGMKLPDGGTYWGKWTFLKITPPSELVFVVSFTDEEGKEPKRNPWNANWPLEMYSKVTLTEENGKTTLNLEGNAYKSTDIEEKTFLEGHESMNQGWGGTFEQLENYLNKN